MIGADGQKDDDPFKGTAAADDDKPKEWTTGEMFVVGGLSAAALLLFGWMANEKLFKENSTEPQPTKEKDPYF